MSWSGYSQQGSGGSGIKREYIQEGNANVYLFTERPTRCRFLTKDYSIEDVMRDYNLEREQASDKLYGEIAKERWIMPKPYWEHSIKDIPNTRFFSTTTCLGRDCPLCQENAEAKERGVTENKLLPYPIRRRFYAPAFFYDLQMCLYVKAAEDFFDEVGNYIDRYGTGIDFEIFKVGKGFSTRYKIVFLGASDEAVPEFDDNPMDFDPRDSQEELHRKIVGGRREGSLDGAHHPHMQDSQSSPQVSQPRYNDGYPRTQTRAEAPRAPAKELPPKAPPRVPAGVPTGDVNTVSTPTPVNKNGLGSMTKPALVDAPSQAVQDSEFVVPFGQYKGKTFGDMVLEGNKKMIIFYAEKSIGLVQAEAKKFIQENQELFN